MKGASVNECFTLMTLSKHTVGKEKSHPVDFYVCSYCACLVVHADANLHVERCYGLVAAKATDRAAKAVDAQVEAAREPDDL